MTYDLEMDDPGHNFVANGIVTHNSHAMAYSFTTYITARLKLLYPLEYLTALMRTVKADKQNEPKRHRYLSEMVEHGFKILPPDVNLSDIGATCEWVDGQGTFRFGFTDCKGIGESKAKKICTKREEGGTYGFLCPDDVKDVVDKGSFAILSAIGALHKIGGDKGKPQHQEEILRWRFKDGMRKLRKKYASKSVFPSEDGKTCILYGEIINIDRRKTKKGDPFVIWTIQWSPGKTWRITLWEDASDVWHFTKGTVVRINGKWQAKWENIAVSSALEQVKLIKAS